jgi:cytochrome c-type biogenesis protein CcmE
MASSTLAEQTAVKMRWRYIIAIIILVPVFAHLFFAITRSPLTNYYITVDELAGQKSVAGKKIRVGGEVTDGSINWNNASRTLEFHIESNGKHLPVNYRGFAPDTFRDGATAIVEGELNRDGTFTAYSVLVKCPHQYVPL